MVHECFMRLMLEIADYFVNFKCIISLLLLTLFKVTWIVSSTF